MIEQDLRDMVAKYDAELAREMEWDDESEDLFFNVGHGVAWYVCPYYIERDQLDGRTQFQRSDVHISIPATMRAMDAAAKAFEEALRWDNARGGK